MFIYLFWSNFLSLNMHIWVFIPFTSKAHDRDDHPFCVGSHSGSSWLPRSLTIHPVHSLPHRGQGVDWSGQRSLRRHRYYTIIHNVSYYLVQSVNVRITLDEHVSVINALVRFRSIWLGGKICSRLQKVSRWQGHPDSARSGEDLRAHWRGTVSAQFENVTVWFVWLKPLCTGRGSNLCPLQHCVLHTDMPSCHISS